MLSESWVALVRSSSSLSTPYLVQLSASNIPYNRLNLAILKRLTISFRSWLIQTKPSFVLHYLKGNCGAGAVNLLRFRDDVWRSYKWDWNNLLNQDVFVLSILSESWSTPHHRHHKHDVIFINRVLSLFCVFFMLSLLFHLDLSVNDLKQCRLRFSCPHLPSRCWCKLEVLSVFRDRPYHKSNQGHSTIDNIIMCRRNPDEVS